MNLLNLFKKIKKTSEKTNTGIFLVGGFVRDLVLNFEEIDEIDIKKLSFKDVDFVVSGSGIEFAKKFDSLIKQEGSLVLFEDFDTARYVFPDGLEVEFAGARTESYTKETRKPKVQVAGLEEDLIRRDFTINSMAVDVSVFLKPKISFADFKKEIIDPFGGLNDLKTKILKTPIDPDKTFFDDPLRMMRAGRFASQLEFEIESKTYEAIKKNAERLGIVSKERIRDELFKTLSAKKPSIGLWIMYNTNLFEYFLPEIPKLYGVEEIYGKTHKNNLSHTFMVVDNIAEKTDNVYLKFAALMHDIAKPGTKRFDAKRGWTFDGHEVVGRRMVLEISRRLRMKKSDMYYVAKLVRWHQQPISLMDESITDSAVRRLIVKLGDELDDLLILGSSDITTGNPYKKKRRLKNYEYLQKRIEEVLETDKLRAFQSPFRGEEIMKEAGLKPGPTVGKIKKQIEEAILNGDISNEYEPAKNYFFEIKDKYIEEAEDWEKQ